MAKRWQKLDRRTLQLRNSFLFSISAQLWSIPTYTEG